MKLLKIFGIVLALHVVVIGVLLIQPGCQTNQNQPAATPPPAPPTGSPEPDAGIHSDFNAGLAGTSTAPGGDLRAPPTRPDAAGMEVISGGADILQPLETAPQPTAYTVVKGDTLGKIAKAHGVSLDELLDANDLDRKAIIRIGQSIQIPGQGAPRAPSASPVVPEMTLPAGGSYVVQPGDSLSRVAKQNGTTVAALKAANGLKSDVIRVGQKLVLPGAGAPRAAASLAAPPPPPSVAAGGSYTVQAGDTLGKIAKNHGVTVGALQTANNISDPKKLRVGQTLVIPAGGSAPVAPPPSVAPRAPAPTPASKPASGTMTAEELQNLPLEGTGEVPVIPVDEVMEPLPPENP